MDDMKLRFDRLSTGFKVAIVVAALLVAAPLAYLALMGVVTLITGIAAAIILTAAIAFGPVWAMKLANWRLKAIMSEAGANPIPTKWNIYRDRVAALEANATKIQAFQAMIGQKEEEVKRLEQAYPDEAPPFRAFISAMKDLLDQRKTDYRSAQQAVVRYKRETEKAETIWNMAMSARELERASGQTALNPMQEIADKTAMASVELEMHNAFAQLDRIMLERVPEPAALPPPAINATVERVAR